CAALLLHFTSRQFLYFAVRHYLARHVDVPRQRLGPAVCRSYEWEQPGIARPKPSARTHSRSAVESSCHSDGNGPNCLAGSTRRLGTSTGTMAAHTGLAGCGRRLSLPRKSFSALRQVRRTRDSALENDRNHADCDRLHTEASHDVLVTRCAVCAAC